MTRLKEKQDSFLPGSHRRGGMLGPTRLFHLWRGLQPATAPSPIRGTALPELCQQGGCANLCLECSCEGRARVYRICI